MKASKRIDATKPALERKDKGKNGSVSRGLNNQQKLSSQQQLELVKYIEQLDCESLPSIRVKDQSFASQGGSNLVGESWVTRVLKNHQVESVSSKET